MDAKILLYRKRHHKCKWCEYAQYHNSKIQQDLLISPYYECILKDKIIHLPDMYKICGYYTPKED